jgi:predicted acyl esterase
VPTLLRRLGLPEDRQQIFQSHAAAPEEAKRNHGVAVALSYAVAQDMVRGSGAGIGHFRPAVHVTLWG